MKKTLFYCGIGACRRSGTLLVSEEVWAAKQAHHFCPACGELLQQSRYHFEDLDQDLQAERLQMIRRKGPLTFAEKRRLRVIHAALGTEHPRAGSSGEDLALARGLSVMRFVRNQELI